MANKSKHEPDVTSVLLELYASLFWIIKVRFSHFICWEGKTVLVCQWRTNVYRCLLRNVLLTTWSWLLQNFTYFWSRFPTYSRRKCNLLERGIEFELTHLSFYIHTVMMNSLFMTLLTFFLFGKNSLASGKQGCPVFWCFFLCPLKQNTLVIQTDF